MSHIHHKEDIEENKDNEKGKLINESHNILNYKKIDPILLFKSTGSEDFYSLIWCAFKKNIWDEKHVFGEHIFLTQGNYIRAILDFFLFISLLGITISIIMYETFHELTFKKGSIPIEILRILLVFFAQKLISPEFSKGTTKFKYTYSNISLFNYPYFTLFVCFSQIIMSIVSYICIVMFMCLSKEALPLVMHFAEVAVLIELDDWVGEMICKESPVEGEENEENIDVKLLNDDMDLYSKLALIKEDLNFVYDYNISYDNIVIRGISYIISIFPWGLLPFFSTILFEYILYKVQPSMIDI